MIILYLIGVIGFYFYGIAVHGDEKYTAAILALTWPVMIPVAIVVALFMKK